MQITINDIRRLTMDKVCLYSSEELNTLWEGSIQDVPHEYLSAEIKTIGSNRKGTVDVGVKLQEGNDREPEQMGIEVPHKRKGR